MEKDKLKNEKAKDNIVKPVVIKSGCNHKWKITNSGYTRDCKICGEKQ